MSKQPLEVRVGQWLADLSLTVATAESCTGGLVGHLLANVPGSSSYMMGGIIAYSNEAKMALLGVNPATLETHGAVSEETVMEMAHGARRAFGTDLAVSVTGVAGPAGGTPEKPVGRVYIGLSADRVTRCDEYTWQSDRLGNKQLSAEALTLKVNPSMPRCHRKPTKAFFSKKKRFLP